ncbi:MAG TPA: YdeI/OmpD-associated family protein [Thermoanaerobaculia bacterium]|nr:YdeI/OmpD-associated family protein [Thermoanaerobaculia bacterium]
MDPVTLEVLIERKHPGMAAFVVVPASAVAAWSLSATTTVEGTLDGILLGRRSLLRWDAERWFVELRRETLKAAGKVPGDRAALVISIASSDLPAELQALIDGVPEARVRWEAHTRAQQRMLREEILAAKSSATRERRARRALLPPERPCPARSGVNRRMASPRTCRRRRGRRKSRFAKGMAYPPSAVRP